MTDLCRLEQLAVLYQLYHFSLLQTNPGKGTLSYLSGFRRRNSYDPPECNVELCSIVCKLVNFVLLIDLTFRDMSGIIRNPIEHRIVYKEIFASFAFSGIYQRLEFLRPFGITHNATVELESEFA